MKRRHIQLTDDANAVIDRLYGEHVRVNRLVSNLICNFDEQWRGCVKTLANADIQYPEFLTAAEVWSREPPSDVNDAMQSLLSNAFPGWHKSTKERWDTFTGALKANPKLLAALLLVYRAHRLGGHNAVIEEFVKWQNE